VETKKVTLLVQELKHFRKKGVISHWNGINRLFFLPERSELRANFFHKKILKKFIQFFPSEDSGVYYAIT